MVYRDVLLRSFPCSLRRLPLRLCVLLFALLSFLLSADGFLEQHSSKALGLVRLPTFSNPAVHTNASLALTVALPP